MKHEMRLNDYHFNLIKNGIKTIELRLNDEKRKLINIRDTIIFTNRETKEKLQTEVINLYKFDSFEELYKNFDKKMLGYQANEEYDYKNMEKYYSLEKQKKYGVLAIEIKLIKID